MRDDIENASVWWEFNDDNSLNLVSASLKAVISADYMTTEEQLKTFVPYFELKHHPEDYRAIVSIDWSFKNPSTGETVQPEVSDVTINYESVEGTSGSMRFYDSWNVMFQYKYNGVTYIWDFSETGYSEQGCELLVADIQEVSIYVHHHLNLEEIETIDLLIWSGDEDIISVDRVKLTPSEEISFDLKGLKVGKALINLLITMKDGSSYDKYIQCHVYVDVFERDVSSDEPAIRDDVSSSDLEVTIIYESEASIVEGVPSYYQARDDYDVMIELRRPELLTDYTRYEYESSLGGMMYLWSNDAEVNSFGLTTAIDYMGWDAENSTSLYEVSYGSCINFSDVTRISWEFDGQLNNSGSKNIPSILRSQIDQLNSYKPYVKLNMSGPNVESISWYFVDSNDKEYTPQEVDNVNICVSRNYNEPLNGYGLSGTMQVLTPEIDIESIRVNFEQDGIIYKWHFRPVGKPYGASEEDTFTWDNEPSDMPLVMTVGESIDLTLTAKSIEAPSVFVGNPTIVSIDLLGSNGSSVTVRLTALSTGMTTISLANGYMITWPREIWVADENGNVLGLTNDVDALLELMTSDDVTSGNSGGWYDDDDNGGESGSEGNDDGKNTYETGEPVDVLAGLSVKPRFVMPTNPSGDIYDAEWDKVYENNDDYSVYMFEVFDDVIADLIERHPAQIPALILPSFRTKRQGTYTFRIPADSITLPGTRMFMHAFPDEDTKSSYSTHEEHLNVIEGISVTSEGGTSILSKKYSVTVSVDMNGDEAQRVIVSSDMYLPEGLSYSVEGTDSKGSISLMKVYANEKFYEIYASLWDEVIIPVVNAEDPEAVYEQVKWGVRFDADDVNMDYYTDDGIELEYVSGDEYINVAVFLEAGEYAPIITAKATSNDIRLVKAKLEPQSGGGSTTPVIPVTSPDVSPDISQDVPGIESPDNPGGDTPGGDDSGGDDTGGDDSGGSSDSGITDNPQPGPDVPAQNEPVITSPDVQDTDSTDVTVEDKTAAVIPTETKIDVSDMSTREAILTIMQGISDFIDTVNTELMKLTNDDIVDTERDELTDEEMEVTTVPLSQRVNVAAYMEAGVEYGPVITTAASSSGDDPGDDPDNGDSIGSIGGPGGGCSAVDSFTPLMLAVVLFALRKKR